MTVSLSAPQRFKLKQDIAHKLSGRSWSEIDLHLEEFGGTTSDFWDGDTFSYVIKMMRGVADVNLLALAEALDLKEFAAGNIPTPEFWQQGKLRLFLSHLSTHKLFASALQVELARLGITAFVAHEDIEPTTEWRDEIEKALRTCDVLVALLHPEFNLSSWTDQEVGFALGRGIPVFSVRLGMEPYGLFGRLQAFSGHEKSQRALAVEIFHALRKHPQTAESMADVVVELFANSYSFENAKIRCGWIEELAVWKPEYGEKIRAALADNTQISSAWGVPDRIKGILAKREPDPQSAETCNEDGEIPF